MCLKGIGRIRNPTFLRVGHAKLDIAEIPTARGIRMIYVRFAFMLKELWCWLFHQSFYIYYYNMRICEKCDKMRGPGVRVFGPSPKPVFSR